MKLFLQELSIDEITEQLKHIHSITPEEHELVLDVLYLDGKFSLQRTFTNDLTGQEKLEETIKEFDTEKKVKAYFGL